MTPDSPDKQAKEEVLDLNDIAEEIVADDASGVHDVDTSFEQELEDLFSEDLELEEPAVGNIEESSEDDDLLVLDDVAEEVSDDDLMELDDAMVLDDVVEEVSDDDLMELDDAMILDDVVEEASDDDLMELDDAMILDDVVEEVSDDAMVLDDVVVDDENIVLDDVLDEAEKLEPADSDADTDAMLENFDLGEEALMAAEDESAAGEVDAEGLDNVIDELGGDSTVAADDKDDIDNLFDGDTDVAALDELLDDSGADNDVDELNDLLGEVSEDVDLSELGEDILADEDIESLLSDDEDILEISEEGLDPLEGDEPEAVSEQVEVTEPPEVVEPAESPEAVEPAEVSEVIEAEMPEAEISETLEVETAETVEDLEIADVSEQSEEILEKVVLDDDIDPIIEETAGPEATPAEDSADIETDKDDSELNELDSSDDSQLEDGDIDLGELLEDVEIDLSDIDENDLMPVDESGPFVTVEAVNELADKVDSFDSELVKLKDLIDSTAAENKDANIEEKLMLAEKRAEDLEVALAESSERIIALEEKVAQIDSLEDNVSSLMATIQGLEERLSSGEIESVVGQKLSETLKSDSPTVAAVAAVAADEIQERVEEWVQTGMLEIKADAAEKITALEEKLNAAPDMAELVSNELEKELDPESTAFYRIKSRLTEDIEDYLTPRLIEKIEEMKGDVEDNFKSTIDEILAEKLERSVPAEAARIIREEIAALARDFDE